MNPEQKTPPAPSPGDESQFVTIKKVLEACLVHSAKNVAQISRVVQNQSRGVILIKVSPEDMKLDPKDPRAFQNLSYAFCEEKVALEVQNQEISEALRSYTPESQVVLVAMTDLGPAVCFAALKVDKEALYCVVCSKRQPEGESPKRCGTCKVTIYCDRHCQRADFRRHKRICASLAQPKATSPSA